MEISRLDWIVLSVNPSAVIEQVVVDCHVVVKEVELAVTPLLHVHLGNPVVGEIEGNVTTKC